MRAGVTVVPALIREFDTFEELAPTPNLLAQEICVGTQPPLMRDFLDDTVSADVWQPATRKVITITAVEAVVA
jgi:hypothetical protein